MARIPRLLRHPHPPIIAQPLTHQGQLRLVIARHRNAGGVDLGVAGVSKVGPPPMAAPGRRHVGVFGIGREVIHIAVAPRAQQHRIPGVALQLPGHQVAHHKAPRLALDHHQLQHFPTSVNLDLARLYHAHHGTVGPQQELLPSLPLGIKGARHLRPPEGAVVEQAAVLPCKGHPLGHALVNNAAADLRQAMHIGLAGAVVAPLDSVVEQPPHAIAIVGVVLRGVDAPLGRNAVGPPR